MIEGPNLLVEWEPRWLGFVRSVKPALARSRPRLVAECDSGMAPGRSTVASFLFHGAAAFFITAVFTNAFTLPAYVHVDPYEHVEGSDYHVIYYRGQELPQMTDAGGAQAGLSGKAGGRELYNATQTIRISRGNKLVSTVVDAPSLKLPRINDKVANLLSLPSGPVAAPPMSALQSLMPAANLAPNITPVAAAPTVAHDRLNTPQINTSVVQPAPNVSRQVEGVRLPDTGLPQPVPAAVSATPADLGRMPRMTLPAASVVEPSPNASLPVGNRSVAGPAIASVQSVDVVPPSPDAGAARAAGGSGTDGGMVGSALRAIGSLIGSVGSPGGGSGSSAGGGGMGLIVSANPGAAVGVPTGEPGSLAMSPSGGKQPGVGGSGGGSGIGRGTGTGSSSHGNGPGSANSGTGFGDGALRPGTSGAPGPGGTGSGNSSSGLSGVTIKGGHVTLPSFSTANSVPGAASHSPAEKRRPPAITVIATSRSGGALNLYGALKGAKVYTIYIDTQIGMAVFQFAERATTQGEFQQDLTAPEVMRSDVPSDIPRSRVLLSCVMDKTGALKNIRILESVKADVTQRVIVALQNWRFRPVLRGEEPVDVDAIVGFNIDTHDNR